MRNAFALFLTLFIFCTSFAQTEKEIIVQCNALVADKKYESAFGLLEEFDHENKRVEIAILKTELARKYFITSMMHQMFSFKDLDVTDDVMNHRGENGTSSVFPFSANEVLETLLKSNPKNCRLHKALADFYYDAHSKYGPNWMVSAGEMKNKMVEHYNYAAIHGCADFMTFNGLGYVAVSQKQYADAATNYKKSIELNPNYAASHYNLAYSYLYADKRPEALKHAKKALSLYKESELKADAARMTATIFGEMGRFDSTLYYYELCDQIQPNTYSTTKALLNLYLALDSVKGVEFSERIFASDPDNPTVYNDLFEIYFGNKKPDLLEAFLLRKKKENESNTMTLANICFYLGEFYLGKDKVKAKEYFLLSREKFIYVYP
ncbi:MAG: tetratricopeptide (TPR) repeat protein, partial [Bacteroidia bacterium]